MTPKPKTCPQRRRLRPPGPNSRPESRALGAAQADHRHYASLADYSHITAPFDGIVTWRYADTGTLLQAGTSNSGSMPAIKLAQVNILRLRLPVPEALAGYRAHWRHGADSCSGHGRATYRKGRSHHRRTGPRHALSSGGDRCGQQGWKADSRNVRRCDARHSAQRQWIDDSCRGRGSQPVRSLCVRGQRSRAISKSARCTWGWRRRASSK